MGTRQLTNRYIRRLESLNRDQVTYLCMMAVCAVPALFSVSILSFPAAIVVSLVSLAAMARFLFLALVKVPRRKKDLLRQIREGQQNPRRRPDKRPRIGAEYRIARPIDASSRDWSGMLRGAVVALWFLLAVFLILRM